MDIVFKYVQYTHPCFSDIVRLIQRIMGLQQEWDNHMHSVPGANVESVILGIHTHKHIAPLVIQ